MKSPAELAAIREEKAYLVATRQDNTDAVKVIVGMGTAGIEAGARPVMSAFVEAIHNKGLDSTVVVYPADLGSAGAAPVVVVDVPGADKVTYVSMSAEKAVRVVDEHIVGKQPVAEFTK